jgi:hypothetical protein
MHLRSTCQGPRFIASAPSFRIPCNRVTKPCVYREAEIRSCVKTCAAKQQALQAEDKNGSTITFIAGSMLRSKEYLRSRQQGNLLNTRSLRST